MALQTDENRNVVRTYMSAEYLDLETEQALARAWRDDRDERALHRLVEAYMRLAISMASKFRRYGAPMGDLIQEASIGLLKAADKFDPDRGVRFSTYATWWIKASIQDHVMRNWSLVRTGSTSAQKSLFFNLKRVQAKLEREAGASADRLDGAQLRQQIAMEMGVKVEEVELMQGRLSGSDFSLNATQNADEDGREWQDSLEDESEQAEHQIAQARDGEKLREWLSEAIEDLTPREREIVRKRKLQDPPRTLASLGETLGISKERVRQLEAGAIVKMRKRLEAVSPEIQHLVS